MGELRLPFRAKQGRLTMDTLGFLTKVLPSTGHYVKIIIPNDAGPIQRSLTTIEDLAAECINSDAGGDNVYYAISTFKVAGNRKQDNVQHTKVFALDVDCGEGKPYTDWKDGLKALLVFIQASKLPKPMIVMSGRGLHVYWVLDTPLPPEEWKPMAEKLKALTVEYNFDCDRGLTTNSALVLRPIGTHNPKNGAEVRLLIDAPIYKTVHLTPLLSGFKALAAAAIANPHPTFEVKSTGLAAAIQSGTSYAPSLGPVIVSKCKQIAWAVGNQDKVDEPMWYNLLGVAAYCADPEDTAIAWSHQHPGFSEANTRAKVQQWKANTTGPTTCAKFMADKPSRCKDCRFKGSLTSPAGLGVQRPEVDSLVNAPDSVAREIKMPKGFKDAGGAIVQTIDGTDLEVCPFNIYPLSYGLDQSLGYEVVKYRWNRKHAGWQELTLRQALITDGNPMFSTALADQGIVLRNGKKQTERFQFMLRAYMDELRAAKAMTNMHATMGWKENDTQFIIGDTVIRKDETGAVVEDEIPMSAIAASPTKGMYTKKGTAQAWTTATAVLENLPWHAFFLNIGFAAPFFKYTGLKGVTVSVHGDTGSGKSLIQHYQQSIYGDPEQLHYTAKFTQNALFSRLGLYNNLPMTVDEMTLVDPKDAGEFCFWVTQGKDKARLTRFAEEKAPKTWSTIVTISTNTTWMSKLDSLGLDSDAQRARLLEFTIPKHSLFDKDSEGGRMIYRHLANNHGIVGRELLKHFIALGPEKTEAMVVAMIPNFERKYGFKFQGDERYWEAATILSDLMAGEAYKLGLLAYDPKIGTLWALDRITKSRMSDNNIKRTCFDILAAYMMGTSQDHATVFHTDSNGARQMDHTREPRNTIKVRFDVYRPTPMADFNRGIVTLVKADFKKWLATNGVDYNNFVADIARHNINATPKTGKFTMGKDTSFKLGQQYVLRLSCNISEMASYISDANDRAANVVLTPAVTK